MELRADALRRIERTLAQGPASTASLSALQSLLPLFSYPGLTLPLVVKSDVADSNLRGAALLVKEHQ